MRKPVRSGKAQVLSAQAHQDLPFDQVVERVKPPRSTAHPPLFQVMFVWQNMPAGELTIPGLTIRAVETPLLSHLEVENFGMTLSSRPGGHAVKKSKFTEEQIAYALKQAELGTPVAEVCRKMGISDATFYIYRKPEAIALTFEGQRLSYAELNARANRLAHYLQARGVGPDRLVALCAERGIEMVVAIQRPIKPHRAAHVVRLADAFQLRQEP